MRKENKEVFIVEDIKGKENIFLSEEDANLFEEKVRNTKHELCVWRFIDDIFDEDDQNIPSTPDEKVTKKEIVDAILKNREYLNWLHICLFDEKV